MGERDSNVLQKAFEEFQRALSGDALDRMPNTAPYPKELEMLPIEKADEVASRDGIEKRKKVAMAMKKGANQKGKRNALGRGLSALMTSNALEVQYSESEQASALAVEQGALSEAIREELPQVEEHTPVANTEQAPAETESQDLPRALQAVAQVQPSSIVPIRSATMGTVREEVEDSISTASSEVAALDTAEGLYEVALDSLIANPDQPRQYFAEEEIEELSQSLLRSGVLQPILVRPAAGSQNEKRYEIIAGERRYRAAKKAGLARVPVLLRELDDREVLEVSIVENVQRSQLNSVEEAQAYQRLQQEYGLSQDEVAEIVGKDRATIANSLRLLKLSENVQDMLITGQLTAGHARALLMLEHASAQEKVAAEITRKLLSVRAAEQLVRDNRADSGTKKKAKTSTAHEPVSNSQSLQRNSLEERFRRALGTKVQLRLNSKGAGELRISFFSQEELEKLLEVLDA